jgi:hypothetical protein
MRRFGRRKVVRYGGTAGVVVLVAIVVAIASATALATPTAKNYKTFFTPIFAPADGLAHSGYQLTLKNCDSTCSPDKPSNQTLGSANYVIPATAGNVTVTNVHGPTLGWHASVLDGVLQIRSDTSKDSLMPGASVVVTLSVTAPGAGDSAACGDYVWHSAVKQSNDFSGSGNDFRLSGTDATLTAAKLAFTAQPSQVVAGSAFSTDVKVTAEDGCGNALPSASGTSVSVAIGNNPAGGTLRPTAPTAIVDGNGVATFSGLSIDTVGTGYTLVASATNFASGTSQRIDVVNAFCEPHHCLPQTSNDTHITATAQTPASGQVGIGFANSPNYTSGFTCGSTGNPIDGQVILIDPSPDAYAGNYKVTLLYDKAVSGAGPASAFSFCISDDGLTWLTPPNPLQACSSPVVTPCISSQKRTTNGALQVILLLAPGDPFVGGK